MKRIVFLILTIILCLPLNARAGVEIFIDGHKYDSFQDYENSKKSVKPQLSLSAADIKKQQDDYIRQEAKKLGIKLDLNKIKTIQIKPKSQSELAQHRLFVLGIENSVVGALQEFYQNWGQSDIRMPKEVSVDQLQQIIEQAVSSSKEPKLLISEPGKVRIMSISADNSH